MQSRDKRFVLRIESGERQGEQVVLGEGALQIGRRPECGLVLKDGSVSGKHAELRVSGGRVELVDLGSTNGTRVGGEKIEQAVISHGDALLFGNIRATLHDSEFAGGGPPGAGPEIEGLSGAPASASEGAALGHVSAEKVTRSTAGSKRSLLLFLGLLVLAGGGLAAFKFLRPAAAGKAAVAIPSVPGNLLADSSFEAGEGAWTSAEDAPAAFLRERGFARSGEVGLGVTFDGEGWSLARSGEATLRARRSVALSGALRLEGEVRAQLGLELASSTEAAPSFVAWTAVQAGGGAFRDLELAFDLPPGYDRARAVVLAAGRGSAALDDVALLERDPLGGAAKFAEYELGALGSEATTALLSRSGLPLLAGLELAAASSERFAWSPGPLRIAATARGFQLEFSGQGAELRFLALRPDGGAASWVATTGKGGYVVHGGDFTRDGVESLLLGSGTELLRLAFGGPVSVSAAARAGGVAFRVGLGGLGACELQLTFAEERANAAALADQALEAERKKDLGGALGTWTTLLDRFPFEQRLVTQASAARARLIQGGLAEVDELAKELQRARFFLLPELFEKSRARAQELAEQYRGSEVEPEARKVAEQCTMALTELFAGARSGADSRLEGVLEALSTQNAPHLTEHVRAARTGSDAGNPAREN